MKVYRICKAKFPKNDGKVMARFAMLSEQTQVFLALSWT